MLTQAVLNTVHCFKYLWIYTYTHVIYPFIYPYPHRNRIISDILRRLWFVREH